MNAFNQRMSIERRLAHRHKHRRHEHGSTAVCCGIKSVVLLVNIHSCRFCLHQIYIDFLKRQAYPE